MPCYEATSQVPVGGSGNVGDNGGRADLQTWQDWRSGVLKTANQHQGHGIVVE